MRPVFTWCLKNRSMPLFGRTLIMGVVNVTPDSFSDGGKFLSARAAVAHGLRMLEEGADIIDIGGESTRPGAKITASGLSAAEEAKRVLPVIEQILRREQNAVISVDTYKSEVARAAVQAGAEIVNDVSAGRWDEAMLPTITELRCGAVLMHARGRPEEWSKLPPISSDKLLKLVGGELKERAQVAVRTGIGRDRLVLDPGFGFGKSLVENFPLLTRMSELQRLGYPLLAGVSRKSFIGRALAREGKDAPVGERLYGSLAAMVIAIQQGAHILRVHDVKEAVETARAADAILAG